MPNATKGTERETVVREFLAKVFPSPFRFGSGAVIDAAGSMSGQLDIVVEFPFFPSFPTLGGAERLYLAESVASAIEVKSDLAAQWSQVEQAVEQLWKIRRRWRAQIDFSNGAFSVSAPVGGGASESQIPLFALGFVGYSSVESLEARLRATAEEKRPDAVLVLDTGAYFCLKRNAGDVGAAGLFAFCTETASLASRVLMATPDFRAYFPRS
jgi:hypothetical protein